MTGGAWAGSRLPIPLLTVAGTSTLFAVLVSTMSILLQLRNYRKPALQRMVIRIMIMVPLYAISSLISLFSVEAAFFIDAIRDVYEAFVIYCFFVLLTSYLGGERSLLILLHGRPPKEPVFPVNLVKREIDVSDPYTFLFLKRGILQYVQVKPVLAFVTMFLKGIGKFNEGDFGSNSGYLYVSIVYNVSICLALYCLAMFWVVVSDDLKPFRPVPKFLCVKGILFFSFWQSVLISALVAAGVVTRLGPYTNPAKVSVGLNDLLICIEMPLFAIAHNYAFSYRDFVDPRHAFVARMPMYYAFRDAFGAKDVVEDSKATLRGKGMDYRQFEPAEGPIHQGVGLENRIRAGLRYTKGGRKKYWLPRGVVAAADEDESATRSSSAESPAVHLAPDMTNGRAAEEEEAEQGLWDAERPLAEGGGYELPFGDIEEADEALFEHCKKCLFGDYNYPTIDVSSEGARIMIWTEEERVLRNERGAWFSPLRGSKGVEALKQRGDGFAWSGYGAVSNSAPISQQQADDKMCDGQADADVDARRIIDHEDHRVTVAAAQPSDVVMRWTKLHRSDSESRTALLKQQQQQQQQVSRPTPPVQDSERARSSPPELVRTKMSTTTTTLPRDAGGGDLSVVVVDGEPGGTSGGEDSGADRGSSSSSSSLKKKNEKKESYYRDGREVVVVAVGAGEGGADGKDDGEGIDEEDAGSTRRRQRDKDKDEKERRRVNDVLDEASRSKTAATAAAAATTSPRPRLPEYRYDDIPHDYNPWA